MAKKRQAKKRTTSKKKIGWMSVVGVVVAGTSALMLSGAALGGGALAYNTLKYDSANPNYDFEIGAVSTVTATKTDSIESIRLKSMVTTDGFRVNLDKREALVNYQIFFYTEDGSFIACTDVLDKDFVGDKVTEDNEDGNIPADAAQALVVVTPVEDEDGVQQEEVSDYADEVKIQYHR